MNDDPELEGVNFLVWFSQGQEIRKTLRDLTFTGIFGSILASVVLFVFLRRVSTTFVAVICIPFSLIVTCGIVWAQGTIAQHADPAGPDRGHRHAGGQRRGGDGEHLPPPGDGRRPQDRRPPGRQRGHHRRGGGHPDLGHRLPARSSSTSPAR